MNRLVDSPHLSDKRTFAVMPTKPADFAVVRRSSKRCGNVKATIAVSRAVLKPERATQMARLASTRLLMALSYCHGLRP